MKNIPLKYLIRGGIAVTLLLLVVSAYMGPKLASYITIGFGGEGDKRYSTEGYTTGLEFAPNMYYSEALETYTQWKPSLFKDGKNIQAAPKGTIPRNSWYVAEDYQAYHLVDTAYESSVALKSPIEAKMAAMPAAEAAEYEKALLVKGDTIYRTFCSVCHGAKGDGQGILVTGAVQYPTPGAYDSKVGLTEGKMFHSLTHGKNLMGSYASQITPEQRWQVIYYIKKNFLKNVATAAPAQAAATPAAATPAADAKAKPADAKAKPAAKPAATTPAKK
jgi:mono/diheme cytochrome c family protein